MRKRPSIESRRSRVGFSFIMPWVLGFFLLYLYPLVMSLIYTFNDLNPATAELSFIGLDNYKRAFLSDADYVRELITNLKVVVYDLPGVLIFSMVIALVLNQKFRSSGFFKVVFFLPIIISSGIIIEKLNQDMVSGMLMSGERSTNMFKLYLFEKGLSELGMGSDIVRLIVDTANSVFGLSWKSCVQILLFIAGLQSIPGSIYEAAEIDGCTAWEKYWKITFPMLAPIIMVNLVYTLTDNFISTGNSTMKMIVEQGRNLNFSYSATLAWVYFVIIGTVIGLAYWIINRRVSYVEV